MGLGLGLGIWWPTQTSIIPGLLKALCARATYCENKTCTTAILEEMAAVRYTAPVLPIGLLADYPGASAAYSLRNLIDTTTSVVRVRRSVDNTEQDFTSAEITDGTLATFCIGTDGFVTTWYDQSTNSNNAVQATATLQPKIVDSGVVILDNGLPAIEYDNTASDNLILNTNISDARSVFITLNQGAAVSTLLGHPSLFNYHGVSSSSIFDNYSANFVTGGDNYINNVSKDFKATPQTIIQSLITMIHTSSSGNIGQLTRDRNQGRSLRLGKLQELIIYPTDQSANRTGIETNINTEYTIY